MMVVTFLALTNRLKSRGCRIWKLRLKIAPKRFHDYELCIRSRVTNWNNEPTKIMPFVFAEGDAFSLQVSVMCSTKERTREGTKEEEGARSIRRWRFILRACQARWERNARLTEFNFLSLWQTKWNDGIFRVDAARPRAKGSEFPS